MKNLDSFVKKSQHDSEEISLFLSRDGLLNDVAAGIWMKIVFYETDPFNNTWKFLDYL